MPANLSKDALLKFLVENKALLLKEKKQSLKRADAVTVGVDMSRAFSVDKNGHLVKAATDAAIQSIDTAICVINTTNWMDSHSDVHIPGIWDKSLRDNSVMLHLQEHEMTFTHIISDESKGYTERVGWKDLGLDAMGTTEALIFATPLNGRHPFMEDQYRKGYVKNHSVGMRYVTIKMCINEPESEYCKEEYANWVQYAPMVLNIEDAEAQGLFWAVLEAKIIEGSAVVKGSNIITPTRFVKSASTATEPHASTSEQPHEKSGYMKWLTAKQLVA